MKSLILKLVFVVALLASTGCGNVSTSTAIKTKMATPLVIVATAHTSQPTIVPTVPTTDAAPEIKSWLREHAVPFNTTDPASDFEDLMPLKELIGDARIVALGEATHGTHEFFEMKHRMLRFLVEEMGFNTFAIEADWSQMNVVNEYVQTGEGDPAKLLQDYFGWVGDTQETLDMIRWMRAHNEQPGDAPLVSFHGFDTPFYKMAMDNVLAYLEQVDPDQASEAAGLYRCFRDRELIHAHLSDDRRIACQANLQAIYDQLSQKQSEYEARSSPEAFARALQSARVVLQVEHQVRLGDHDYLVRDQYMAENVSWLLDQAGPNGKIVLSAHNFHVGTIEDHGLKTMGKYLREYYGNEMIVFGFAFYEGSFNAKLLVETAHMGDDPGDLTQFTVPLPPEDSYENYFHSTELPRFFLDLRQLSSDPAIVDWWSTPHYLRSIGSAYQPSHPEEFLDHTILPDLFDVMIYLEDTSPSVLLK